MTRTFCVMGALALAAGCGGSGGTETGAGTGTPAPTEPTATSAGAEQPPAPGAEAEGEETTPDAAASGSERMSFADALAKGREHHPDAPPIEVEIEIEDGRELMEVELIVEGEVRAIYMDPVTGEHVKDETEELDEQEAKTLPLLEEKLAAGEASLEDAIELALSKYDASAIREIELEIHGEDQLVLEVGVDEDGETVEYVLDPESGEVQGRETDEETHEVEPVGETEG